MRTVRDYQYVREEDRGASVAIGNFDGVHLGHQAVIGIARNEARRRGVPLGVVTFEPHPREVFAPDAPPFRLMNAEAKAHRLEKLDVDILYELNFNKALSSLAPEDFARNVIAGGLGLSHVVVGEDFCFGKGRAGTAADLARFGAEMGFGVTVTPLLETGGVEVSSTRIREALSDGRPRDAARMLGHLHRIEGAVIRGDQRGRELGYPTANMHLPRDCRLRYGIYAVRMRVDGIWRDGVASFGSRPTFDDGAPRLESHLFDFAGDLYGKTVDVALVAWLRGEAKFEALPPLIAQMDADSRQARDILGRTPPFLP
jgi:riboflavin kinase/FMN adenylyltransferase